MLTSPAVIQFGLLTATSRLRDSSNDHYLEKKTRQSEKPFLIMMLNLQIKSPQTLISELALFGALVMDNKHCSK